MFRDHGPNYEKRMSMTSERPPLRLSLRKQTIRELDAETLSTWLEVTRLHAVSAAAHALQLLGARSFGSIPLILPLGFVSASAARLAVD